MTAATDSLFILTAGGGMGFIIQNVLFFAALIGMAYFLIIRPQQQRMKKHREMVDGLRKGDDVVTSGGFLGKVTKVTDTEATVEIAEGVRVKVVKATISEVRNRTEPANDSSDS
ncbi:preprotein translocase subunit YajC [Maricaulaceae bacterium EIL42A08]|nr:preprotein translocase subunit YajC [Maricaulaceae bacterium EIL42A08]MCP2678727.1 preprotein translocase subunit YajC [Maricaulaceae bacterium NA33B04]